MEKITIDEIKRATGCEVFLAEGAGGVNEITDIVTDTRKFAGKSGALFIPLKGENFDGNDYIDDFFAKNGTAALKTRDGMKALADLARAYRSRFDLPVVAVTGSAGKTMTKEMLGSVLSMKYKTLKTEGNFNNEIGLPLTIFGIDDTIEVALVEMGMNSLGELSRLSSIARPSICVITNIGTAHIGKLGSRDNILRAKLEVLDFIQPNGVVALNADDERLYGLRGKLHYRTIFFGVKNEPDESSRDGYVRARNLRLGDNGAFFEVELDGMVYDVHIEQVGEHNVYNALAAIAVGHELGVPVEEILNGLRGTAPIDGRQKIRKIAGLTVIDDSYNANLESMLAGLKTLAHMGGGTSRKIAVLGSMLEQGEFAEKGHKMVGRAARDSGVDYIITIGDDANAYIGGDVRCGTVEEVYSALTAYAKKGDIVLLKGSRGVALERLIRLMESTVENGE
ncbi:MAG: UDP-N-acetylmuramoyl-tripeptide--D-alanyl-D-alanine ligase [Clostridiales bacterium]|jgi:UDP-N-acetylmuramoyl-tripeptide--D-alanyl-D-alanine ligase|nr:UDP-N-acetylmuramoyl-tripeptide--D-alanyl-D-alanine ligase [Clostridiales bacterium]